MLKSPKTFPLLAAGLALLLSACGATGTVQQSEQPSALATSAPASTTAPSPSAVAETSATGTPAGEPTSSPGATTGSALPEPTVVEEAPGDVELQPAPTGTVVTVEPTEAPAASPGGLSADAQAAAPSSAAGVAVCDYGQLYIAAAVSDGAGAAGSRYITLTFTNTGNAACSMSGYPSVHYVDSAGQQVGAAAAHASEWSASGTVLAAGESTTATLRETRAQLFGETCQNLPSAGYSVQAPGASQALVLNFPAEACSNEGLAQLSVGAVGATP